MILGIGTDLTDVADMERRLARGTIKGVFSPGELAYADSRPSHRAQILAARWAAKEAFGKALGTGLLQSWISELAGLEVVRDDLGRPSLALSPFFSGKVPADTRIHLTLSHTETSAVATVILEIP